MNFLHKAFALGMMVGAVSAQWPPCNICDDGEVIGNPDAILLAGLAGILPEDTTCAELDGSEEFNVIQCNLIKIPAPGGAVETCNCKAAVQTPVATPTGPPPSPDPVTPASTPAPTDAPVVVVVLAPTGAPVVVVVEPTMAPMESAVDPTAAPVIEVAPTGT